MARARAGGWVVLLSFLVAFILTSLPLPEAVNRFRPNWLGLVLAYWCLALPQQIGIVTGWLLGLLLDATRGALLGQHALALALLAFLTLRWHRRLQRTPLWLQSGAIGLLLLPHQALLAWIDGMAGYPPPALAPVLTPVLGSLLLWPWVCIVLHDLQRRWMTVED